MGPDSPPYDMAGAAEALGAIRPGGPAVRTSCQFEDSARHLRTLDPQSGAKEAGFKIWHELLEHHSLESPALRWGELDEIGREALRHLVSRHRLLRE